MNRATKLIVIASNLMALWLEARLVSRGIPPILVPAAIAFAVSCALSFAAGEVAAGLVLSVVYLVPTLCAAKLGTFQFSYYAIWLAALSGAMLGRGPWSSWAFPRYWTAPLVLWALTIALGWPIVVLRELDFSPALLERGNLWLARSTVTPPTAATWILNVASIAMTGLLFFDWLLRSFPAGTEKRFERLIIAPIFAGAVLASAVAAYQSVIDLNFLNRSMWPSLGRTVGTMWDANAFGAAMALWVPVAAGAVVTGSRNRLLVAATIPAFAVFCLAVWSSGSRSALIIALIGLLVLAGHALRGLNGRRALAVAAGVAVVAAVIVVWLPESTIGPWKRSIDQVPGATLSWEGLKMVAERAWRRDLYGPAGAHMIAQHPLVGIGLGNFNYQFADALYAIDPRTTRTPDNAQNWYRQQFAEVGLIGSLGWIVWLSMFTWMLLRVRGERSRQPDVGALKGAVVGFGAGSLFGVPAQDAAVSLTFITLLAWCVRLMTAEDRPGDDGDPGRLEWVGVIALLGCFLAGTLYAAKTDLRPPYRALRADFPYSYGFSDPDPATPGFRWTGRRAVDVFRVDKRWMKVELGAVAPDADTKPVDVRVWFNRQLILNVTRRSNFPLIRYIRLPEAGKSVMIEIDVDRTWRPSDFGSPGIDEARGVAVATWEFSDADPAKGSLTIE